MLVTVAARSLARVTVFRMATSWLFMGALVLVVYVGACSSNSHRIQARFETVAVGASEARVMATMGAPDATDGPDTVNALYASRTCEPPCTRRVWYYNRLQAQGIEAWSFELGADGRVLHAAHWVSP